MYNSSTSSLSLYLVLFLIFTSSCSESSSSSNTEWQSLFDGESFNGWKMYGADNDSISPKWIIENGVIIASEDGDGPGINTGFDESIMTLDQFENFELELEFKISEGGNSGIMYHVVEDSNNRMDYYTGHEYQILDDYHFENQLRDFQYTASVFGLYPAGPKELNQAGEWNTARILVDNGKTEHWLNGALVLEFDRNSPEYQSTYEESQWPQFPDWGNVQFGHISLQDHGDKVSFKNIRIRKL